MYDHMKTLINNGFCTGCGVCVSQSRHGGMKMIKNPYGFLIPVNIREDENKECLKVCPFNPKPEFFVKDEDILSEHFLSEALHHDDKIGRFENTYIGYSKDYRENASSGGIATFIFNKLLKLRIVDRLYIVREYQGRYQYQFFDNQHDIKQISKTRYYPVTMESLFTELDEFDGKVAVSGVGCFIKAIRLKQRYYPEYNTKIPFLVGIVCGGVKSTFFSDFLASAAGAPKRYISPQFRIKDPKSHALDYSFGCHSETNGAYYQLKMRKVGDMWGTGYFKSNACDFCTDVTTELADISLGDAWLDEYIQDGGGTSIIITRSKLADEMIQNGILTEELIVNPKPKALIIHSQKSSFIHRQDAIKFRFFLFFFKRKHIPYYRQRFCKIISLTAMLVQVCRRVTRYKSLSLWKKYPCASVFMKHMYKYLILLKIATRLEHLYRKYTEKQRK